MTILSVSTSNTFNEWRITTNELVAEVNKTANGEATLFIDTLSANTITANGNIAVNGGEITTTASVANVVNTNASTVNIAGAADTIVIGSSSGTTDIKNNLNVTGDLDIDGGDLTFSTATANIANTTVETLNFARVANTIVIGSSTSNTTISGNAIVNGNVTVAGELRGPSTFVIDPATVGDNTGTVVIRGNLQIDGSSTVVNSANLAVQDALIVVANGAINSAAANGAGIFIDGAAASLYYTSSNDSFNFNKNLILDGQRIGINTTSPGSALDVKGVLRLSGSSSGFVGLAPAANAGSITFTLPASDGLNGQVLSTNGTGALQWVNPIIGEGANTGSGTSTTRTAFTATEGQTTFSVNYVIGQIDVFLNGSKLVIGTEAYANTGNTVVLAEGAIAGDILDTVVYSTQWSLNGINLFYNGGSVGIGTSAPNARLSLGAADSSRRLLVYDGGDNSTYAGFGTPNANTSLDIFTFAGGTLRMGEWSSGGAFSERMRITPSGNVAIGTTIATSLFHVNGTITAGSYVIGQTNPHLLYSLSSSEIGIRIGNSGPFYSIGTTDSNNMRINSSSGGDILLSVSSSEVARVTSSGNVGIGTSNPGQRLSVNGNIEVTGNIIPTANVTYDLGTTTLRFRDLYLANNTIYMGPKKVDLGKVNPTIRPSLSFDFVHGESFDDRITFTRSTRGTVMNKSGLIEIASFDVPRLEYDVATSQCNGLLIEEQRTNLITNSGQFDATSWLLGADTPNSTPIVMPNSTIAPDGTFTACKVKWRTTGLFSYLHSSNQPTLANTTYTSSCYYKADTSANVRHNLFSSSVGDVYVIANLTSGTIETVQNSGSNTQITNYGIKSVGNGWHRVWLTVNTGANTTIAQVQFGRNPDIMNGGSVYVWGPQMEVGSFPTSYIPTTSTFSSRASSATYFDKDGILRISGANQSRYSYGYDITNDVWVNQGLLLERAATNLVTNSENVYSWANTSSITETAAIYSPNSISYVNKFVPDTSNGEHFVQFSYSIPANTAVGTLYSMSVFVKPAGLQKIEFRTVYQNGNNDIKSVFDIANGSFDFTTEPIQHINQTIVNCGNGWYRIGIVYRVPTYENSPIFTRLNANNNITPNFAGDGSNGYYVWGAQIESGNKSTSYIPTYGVEVTRAADISTSSSTTRVSDHAVVENIKTQDWFNTKQGTMYVEGTWVGGSNPSYPGPLSLLGSDPDTDSLAFAWGVGASYSGQMRFGARVGSTSVSDLAAPPNKTAGSNFKVAGRYAVNDFQFASDGNLGTPDTSAPLPNLTTLSLGGPVAYQPTSSVVLSRVKYFKLGLSDAELEALTK